MPPSVISWSLILVSAVFDPYFITPVCHPAVFDPYFIAPSLLSRGL